MKEKMRQRMELRNQIKPKLFRQTMQNGTEISNVRARHHKNRAICRAIKTAGDNKKK